MPRHLNLGLLWCVLILKNFFFFFNFKSFLRIYLFFRVMKSYLRVTSSKARVRKLKERVV